MLPCLQENQVSPQHMEFAVSLLVLPAAKACQVLQQSLEEKRYTSEDIFLLTTLFGNETDEQRAVKQRFRAVCDNPVLDTFWVKHSGGWVQCAQRGLSTYAIFAGHMLTNHGTSLLTKNYSVAVAWWGVAAQQYNAYAAFLSIFSHASLALYASPKSRDVRYLDSRVQALHRFCLGFKDIFPLLSIALCAIHLRYSAVAYGRIAGQYAKSNQYFISAERALSETEKQAEGSIHFPELCNGFSAPSERGEHLHRFSSMLRQCWGVSSGQTFREILEADRKAAQVFAEQHGHGCRP